MTIALFISAGPVCSSFSAEACAILQVFLLVSAAPTSLPFLFSYLTLFLSSPPSFLLSQSLWQIWQELFSLSSCSIRLQWVPRHSFLPGTMRLMSWPDREHYLCPLQSLVVSPLFRVHASLFSDWRRTVSSKFFDTQVPSIFTKELVLPRHARCVFSRLRFNGRSPLLSFHLFRIGRIENSSCCACGHSSQDTSHLILPSYGLFAPLALWQLSVSLRPLVQAQGSCPAFGTRGLPPCPHPSEGVG